MIKLYNSLTRNKEVFKPLIENQVSMYVCGPTVYNFIHIGNARSTVAFDTIRRYFLYRGYEVNYVSNFTDVDDKIIKAAKESGSEPKEVAERFIAAFHEDTALLNVMPATCNPRVMENIPEIIEFIGILIDKGYAYESDGDVYYRTKHFKEYGKLSDQNLAELLVGASDRITTEEQERKESPVDFALWKKAKGAEIYWESPWSKGRPGWHIECSVMATKYLGDTIDIHGGGHDLIFPHHENEIAQSEAKTGQTFANYWLHNGFVTMGDDGEKMSKSLGNFIVAHDLLQEVDPQVVRFLLSSAHYRSPIKFNEANLKEATNNLDKIKITLNNLNYRLDDAEVSLDTDAEQIERLAKFTEVFITAMDDDFNAPNGLTEIYQLIKDTNIYLEEAQVSAVIIEATLAALKETLAIFGLDFAEELLDDEIVRLIDERTQARKDKNFARSDEIRDFLKDKGIILDDTPQGTRWRRDS